MALFGGKKSYLGLDLGTSSLKLVELSGGSGEPRLITYGFIEEPTDIIKADSQAAQARTVKLLKELIKKSRATATKVVAALPSFTVFSSIISLPAMSNKDLNAAIRWEAKKFVPMPLDEMVLDWRLLKELAGPRRDTTPTMAMKSKEMAKNLKILLTAAPKNLVKRYIEIFKALNLQIVSLETEAFALERSLIGADPSPVMIIDIGALATNICIIYEGVPILNRGIDVGGETITKAIANALNIDLARAEQFKRDFGLSAGSNPQSQIPKTIEFVISSITNEVKHCFNLYHNVEDVPVEKIVLAGGSSFLPGLTDYISNFFQIKTIIGDPWARVAYPEELKPVLEEIGPRFAVASGLALREVV
ncbi:MAG: type IV pilus assembly protein PilM [Patescibacteria group bacterium]